MDPAMRDPERTDAGAEEDRVALAIPFVGLPCLVPALAVELDDEATCGPPAVDFEPLDNHIHLWSWQTEIGEEELEVALDAFVRVRRPEVVGDDPPQGATTAMTCVALDDLLYRPDIQAVGSVGFFDDLLKA